MKLLVVLLVLPCVLAGDFAKMWAEVEKELETKGWGEKKEVSAGNEQKGTEESKEFGEKTKGWGEEHKGWGDEKKETEKKKEDKSDEEKYNEEHKGWGEKPKGWGEEHKGWGDEKKETEKKKEDNSEEEKYNEEHKGWGEKPKGWGEEHKGWGPKENSSHVDKESKAKSLVEDFKSWLTQQEKNKKEKDDEKEYLKANLEKFKEYMKMKQYKEKQEQEAKDVIKKEMEKVQMKKMLTEKLYKVSKEHLEQKMKFTQEIASHFLEFCECDNSKDLFERVTSGHFGDVDATDNSWDFNDSSEEEQEDEPVSGNMTVYNGESSNSNYTSHPESNELMKTVMCFAKMSPKEQAKHVLHDLVKVMCTSATHYMGKMKQVEVALVEFKKTHTSHD